MTADPYVLIVDDEQPVRDVIGRMLARSGLRLRYATNADDALAEVYAHPPMVVVADVHMPGRSGLWLASQVQDISPRTAIVLASGDVELPSSETLR
ncbi:MAG TPA: response regulator, partial [Vicinamibacterales bacterium]|nr:response regulator [Vicinamibacterales bacterium]